MCTVVTGSSTVMVYWTPSLSGMCDVLSTGYSIRYRLSGSTGDYTTVNTSGSTTSVTLVNLAPNAEYDVEVAAINSNGAISNFSAVARFTVTPPEEAKPSKILYFPIYYSYHLLVHAYMCQYGCMLSLCIPFSGLSLLPCWCLCGCCWGRFHRRCPADSRYCHLLGLRCLLQD